MLSNSNLAIEKIPETIKRLNKLLKALDKLLKSAVSFR